MSDQKPNDSGAASQADIANRAQIRRENDERLVAAVKVGDAETFGRLFDDWVDAVHDRLVRQNLSPADVKEAEGKVFQSAWRELSRGRIGGSFGAGVMRSALREAQGKRRPTTGGSGVEERLTRATNLQSTATDAAVGTLLFEAAEALGQKAREVLDLHFRHGLTASEIGEVLGTGDAEVDALIRKLPAAYEAVVRSRILWNGGAPDDAALAKALADANVTAWGPDAVRVITKEVKANDKLRGRSMIPLGALALFSAVPMALPDKELKEAIAVGLVGAGVPLGRSVVSIKAARAGGLSAAAAATAAEALSKEQAKDAGTPAPKDAPKGKGAPKAEEPKADDGKGKGKDDAKDKDRDKALGAALAAGAAGAAAGAAAATGADAAKAKGAAGGKDAEGGKGDGGSSGADGKGGDGKGGAGDESTSGATSAKGKAAAAGAAGVAAGAGAGTAAAAGKDASGTTSKAAATKGDAGKGATGKDGADKDAGKGDGKGKGAGAAAVGAGAAGAGAATVKAGPAPKPAPTSEDDGGGGRKGLIAAAVVVAVLLIGGIAFALTSGGDEDGEVETAASSTTRRSTSTTEDDGSDDPEESTTTTESTVPGESTTTTESTVPGESTTTTSTRPGQSTTTSSTRPGQTTTTTRSPVTTQPVQTTTTTRPPTTTATTVPPFQFTANFSVQPESTTPAYYPMAAAPRVNWNPSVSAGYTITSVTVTGPNGFNQTSRTGSVPVCPGPVEANNICGAPPGSYTYNMVVQVAGKPTLNASTTLRLT